MNGNQTISLCIDARLLCDVTHLDPSKNLTLVCVIHQISC